MYSSKIALRIFGDICSDRDFKSLFREGNSENIFGFSLELVSQSDIAIANLECPLTSEYTPAKKTGPCLAGPPETATVLANAGFNAVSISNNHIMDHGSQGLIATLKNCKTAGLQTVGAGNNIYSARLPLVLEAKGLRVGFYSMAETEFSIASENNYGANGIDAVDWIPDLRNLESECDYIVVLLHAGKENYPLPTPRTQRLSHALVDNGVNLVVCQHSHCIGAVEKYKDSVIVYGQGNFLFSGDRNSTQSWNHGFIIDVEIDRKKTHSFNQIYYQQFASGERIRKLNATEQKLIIKQQAEIDAKVLSSEEVCSEWRKLASAEAPKLLFTLGGYGKFISRVLRRMNLHKILYRGLTKTTALNLIRCQTHREMLETFLDDE